MCSPGEQSELQVCCRTSEGGAEETGGVEAQTVDAPHHTTAFHYHCDNRLHLPQYRYGAHEVDFKMTAALFLHGCYLMYGNLDLGPWTAIRVGAPYILIAPYTLIFS